MITIGKVRNAEYYLTELGRDDAHDYYAGLERTGTWHGHMAADLDLVGEVDPEDFRAILEGVRPDTGTSLTEFPIKMPALDVTLSVPKSISVLWATDKTAAGRREVEQAIDEAQQTVIDLLEAEATVVRRGHGGHDYQPGSGLIVAAFDHRTSRLGDPNLHRHLVVANASRGPDQRITGIDTRQLYKIRYTAEAVFQASLRHELTTRLGVRYTEIDRHGVAEIDGIAQRVLREFSQRRRDIEAAMADRGTTSGKGARLAALATRPNKQPEKPDNQLRVEWRARALAHKFEPSTLPTQPRTPTLHIDTSDLARAITDKTPTFSRWDVIRHVARSATDGATLPTIRERAEEFIASSQCIERTPGVYTTPEILNLETHAARNAVEGQATGTGLTHPDHTQRALDARPHLSDEQRDLVTQTTGSGDRITIVIGKAGAGKTTALDALRDAYEHAGYQVHGAALSARAAAELTSGAGINSATVHRTINQIDQRRLRLDQRRVLVIDEAAMVGTRQLAGLIHHTSTTGTKLVLVGDPRQLPEIDAGGLFAAIARRTPPIELTTNRRQHDPTERDALDALRNNNTNQALDQLERNGNITTGHNADHVRNALVNDWHTATTEGDHTIMIAATRSDVADLNHRARTLLQQTGTISDPIWTNDTTEFAKGDRIVAGRNRYDLGLLNGQQGTITSATRNGVTIELDNNTGTRHVPNDYINDGHLTHAYAITIHKAQGHTVDRAYLLGDDQLYNELGYTGLSRGRHHNHLYTVTSRNEHGPGLDPLADLRHALGTSRAQTAAIDHGRSR